MKLKLCKLFQFYIMRFQINMLENARIEVLLFLLAFTEILNGSVQSFLEHWKNSWL
jgi:hypothetical protein